MTAAAWDVPACDRQVRRLVVLAEDLERVRSRILRLPDAVGWTGAAAGEARLRIGRAALGLSLLAGLVRRAADAVWSGLPVFADAVRLATTPAQDPSGPAEAAAVARAVDYRTATALAGVRPAPRSAVPPAAVAPADVARWWTALPPHLRDAAIAGHPEVLGALPGLPAVVRDAANRRLLTRLLGELRRCRADLHGTDPDAVRRRADVTARLRLAESVERRLAELARTGTRATLLTLDLEGTGRVAIGIGDLDRARHVAVVVPGMGQDAAHGLERTVQQAVGLRAQAGAESGVATATVAWTGYAAPGLLQVPFATRARAGGRLLAADLLALSASRQVAGGDAPHLTVIGHSYGSTVVGAAATAGRVPADDLVLLGSPGTLAGSAAELAPAGRVWVGEARFDLVADLGAFGPDPGDEDFGATRIAAEPGPGVVWSDRLTGGDHSHYYDPGSEALRNVAKIVVGRGADATRVG